jgi:hypothetical protein
MDSGSTDRVAREVRLCVRCFGYGGVLIVVRIIAFVQARVCNLTHEIQLTHLNLPQGLNLVMAERNAFQQVLDMRGCF